MPPTLARKPHAPLYPHPCHPPAASPAPPQAHVDGRTLTLRAPGTSFERSVQLPARLETEGLSVAWDGPSHTLQLSGKLLPEAGESVEDRPYPAAAPAAPAASAGAATRAGGGGSGGATDGGGGGSAAGAALAGDDLDLQRQLAGAAPRDIPVELSNATKDEL